MSTMSRPSPPPLVTYHARPVQIVDTLKAFMHRAIPGSRDTKGTGEKDPHSSSRSSDSSDSQTLTPSGGCAQRFFHSGETILTKSSATGRPVGETTPQTRSDSRPLTYGSENRNTQSRPEHWSQSVRSDIQTSSLRSDSRTPLSNSDTRTSSSRSDNRTPPSRFDGRTPASRVGGQTLPASYRSSDHTAKATSTLSARSSAIQSNSQSARYPPYGSEKDASLSNSEHWSATSRSDSRIPASRVGNQNPESRSENRTPPSRLENETPGSRLGNWIPQSRSEDHTPASGSGTTESRSRNPTPPSRMTPESRLENRTPPSRLGNQTPESWSENRTLPPRSVNLTPESRSRNQTPPSRFVNPTPDSRTPPSRFMNPTPESRSRTHTPPSRFENPTPESRSENRIPPSRFMNLTLESRSGNRTPPSRSNSPPPSTPEPQPLTKTNVTKHDVIWIRDGTEEQEETAPGGILSPPLRHITPETTAELWRKFDPIDVLDSASDRSDSSADTMIMMTTDEEQKNKASIDHSLKEFQDKKEDETCADPSQVDSSETLPGQLHIDTTRVVSPDSDRGSLGKSPGGSHGSGSPEETGTDDGYGTNTSTTISSPLSSSLSSLLTSDLENSSNQSSLQKGLAGVNGKQNGSGSAIQKLRLPNSGLYNYAVVKRKAWTAESHDNSLQEKLRQLTIIEEDQELNTPCPTPPLDGSAVLDNHGNSDVSFQHSSVLQHASHSSAFHAPTQTHEHSVQHTLLNAKTERVSRKDHQRVIHVKEQETVSSDVIYQNIDDFVSFPDSTTVSSPVFPTSLESVEEGMLKEMDRNYRNYYGFDHLGSDDSNDNTKVMYFHEKLLKHKYDHDNYYQPKNYTTSKSGDLPSPHMPGEVSQRSPASSPRSPGPSLGVSPGLSKNMVSMPNLCQSFSISPRGNGNLNFQMVRNSCGDPINGDVSTSANSRHSSYSMSSQHSWSPGMDSVYQNNKSGVTGRNRDLHQGLPSKGRFVSVDNIHKNCRGTGFASSSDILKLFQSSKGGGSQQPPVSHRHSFHAMPAPTSFSYRVPSSNGYGCGQSEPVPQPRPRSSSASTHGDKPVLLKPINNQMCAMQNHMTGSAQSVKNLPHRPSRLQVPVPGTWASVGPPSPSSPLQARPSEVPFNTVTVREDTGDHLTTLV